MANCSYDEVDAPPPREVMELEASISSVEENIREVSGNYETLM